MQIISWNVNGLRAVHKKNFLELFNQQKADIFCLQEIKADPEQLPEELRPINGYFSYFNSASKKGYSGVAVYSKEKPLSVKTKLGLERFNQEGRFLQLEFTDFILINIYLPHGGREKENLSYKLESYQELLNYLPKISKPVILIGDFNIAHQEIDLERPKDNKNNIMFTSEEREKIDQLLSLGFKDSFRLFNQNNGNYTWWPYRLNARSRNLGWRLDYAFVSQSWSGKIKSASILKEVFGSDHGPISLVLE